MIGDPTQITFLATTTPVDSRLIGIGVAMAIGAIALLVIRMARGDQTKPIAINSLTHRTELIVLVPWVVLGRRPGWRHAGGSAHGGPGSVPQRRVQELQALKAAFESQSQQ